MFISDDNNFVFTNVIWNKDKSQLILNVEFKEDLNNITLNVLFNPSASTDQRYFATLNQIVALVFPNSTMDPYYYSPFTLATGKMIQYISYVNVVLGFLSYIIGIFLRRLAGLEAMFVLQFSYINMIWLNCYMFAPFQQTAPLKFSTGYNYPFLS